MMKRSFCFRGGSTLILLIWLAVAASAGNITLRGGYTPSGYSSANNFTYDSGSNGGTALFSGSPVAVGSAVELYWMGPNGVINDPGYSDDVLIGAVKYVGSDSDSNNNFSLTAGKFYHDYSAGGSQFVSGNNFYFRVWNNAVPANSGAVFGESGTVTANYDPNLYPLPTNNGLTPDLNVQFPQDAPGTPAFTGSNVTINQAPSGGNPTIRVSCPSAVHGRWYEFQVSNTSESSSFTAVYPYISDSVTNSQHAADTNATTTKYGSTRSLGRYDDGKYVKVRVRACNDYGNSQWVESGALLIPVTQSSNRPAVVSDLQASTGSGSITLTWTAPYLLDAHNALMPVSAYDIRIATTPIVDTWEAGNTNPNHVTNWSSATPVTSAPYNATLPTPLTYSNGQTVTISNVPTGSNYYLALKSKNGTISSYISNVTGAGFGGGAGGSQTWTLTIESRTALGGHGINHFSMPFAGPWYVYKQDGTTLVGQVSTAYDLVKAIDSAAGANIISTFTKWVGAASSPNETGVIIAGNDPDGLDAQSALQAIPLANGTAFELYSSQSVKVVIKNY